jgi:hypothetical protein
VIEISTFWRNEITKLKGITRMKQTPMFLLLAALLISTVVVSGRQLASHDNSPADILETKPKDTPEHLKYEQETTLAQARWLGLSSNSKQIFARNSSEYIQFDEPETAINAVREVYDQARRPVGAHRDQK